MKVFENAWNRRDLPSGAVATIGNYDGVHRGQRAILDRVVERSRALGCPPAVVTFAPHPAKLLSPESAPRCLATPEQKERLLAEAGIEYLFVVDFDAAFAQTSARTFCEVFLHARLALREIYVGSRFVFGKGREGTLELLQEVGGSVHPAWGVEEVTSGGAPISSTRIREAVATGSVEEAQSMLGRPFEVTGMIEHGAGRGKELGWPTINLAHDNELIPAHGVYVTVARTEGVADAPADFPSVTNVGVRPTLHADSDPTVECHLLGYDGDLYGKRASVGFLRRLRGEQAFADLEALRTQIALDVQSAEEHFQTAPTRASRMAQAADKRSSR